jgi:hypothetical protein
MQDPEGGELASIVRIAPLQMRVTPDISQNISIYRASYKRLVPTHYAGNPHIRETVDINVILAPGGFLLSPSSPQTSFQDFYEELRYSAYPLLQRVLSPSGTAKAVSTNHPTPIKEIAGMSSAGLTLPGDRELYGWHALEREAAQKGLRLDLFFQGNGLYYNRGSVLYDGTNLLDYPGTFLNQSLDEVPSPEIWRYLAIEENAIKRPLLFFVTRQDHSMTVYQHFFRPGESYHRGMKRLQDTFRKQGVRSAVSASPPLIVPNEDGEPLYLSLQEALSRFHANDVRHYLYCPYSGTVLLSGELGRAQCLEPVRLAASLSGLPEDRIALYLSETLSFLTAKELAQILDQKGYSGRFSFDRRGQLSLSPLEGVYSHLLLFLTRQGQPGMVQTSGTHGNITGNDGPTFRQLSAILRDLNSQPPFIQDPIIAAVSGSQGNDVPNIVCRGIHGDPGLLADLAPTARLDDHPAPRGNVTTPRVGIVFRDKSMGLPKK